MRFRDDRVQLFVSTGLIVLLGACSLIAVSLLQPARSIPVVGNEAVSSAQAEGIARQYLDGLKQLPQEISAVKAERYWVPANNYWESALKGKAMPLEPPYKDCWVVTFSYTDLHPETWKTVYVDIKTGRVVGGSWCGH